jgi:hypothetical protein
VAPDVLLPQSCRGPPLVTQEVRSGVISASRAAGWLALGLSVVRRDNRTFAEVRTDD